MCVCVHVCVCVCVCQMPQLPALLIGKIETLIQGIPLSCIKGCTHRATEVLRWLSMTRYRWTERVCCSVDTLLCCDRGDSSKWVSREKVLFNDSFAMGMFSY